MSEPWEEFPEIWPTKAKFFTYLRGSLRKAVWNRWIGKLMLKNQSCEPPPEGLETRAKTGTHCALTGEWIGKSKLEVDHIEGGASLTCWEDLIPFVQHLCAPIEALQLVSKEAHKIKSYAERMNISFEDARLEKRVIKFKKLKAKEQLAVVAGKTKKDRENAYRELLRGEDSD